MTATRTSRRALLAAAAAAVVGLGIVASAAPAFAMGTGNPYEDIQVGVGYTVYQPSFTAGLKTPKTATGGDDCKPGVDENLVVAYGPKATPSFVVYEGNPLCTDLPQAQQVAAVKVAGATAKLYAFCPQSQSCMRQDVKKLGGYIAVTLPAVSGLTNTNIQIQTDGQNAISARQLIKIARSLAPVQ